MSHTLTRRGLVAAAPAAVVAAAVPMLANADQSDAALMALRKPYEATLAVSRSVSPAHDRAEEAFYAAEKAHPHLDRADLEKMSGLDVAAARWEAALDLNSDVILQIIATPARTIRGLAFKAKICKHESIHPDLAESIVDDLLALGGRDA